ncbi:MAG: phosphotransferase family protein [Sphingobium sp.]
MTHVATAETAAGSAQDVHARITRLFTRIVPGGSGPRITRLSGGASQESWLICGTDAGGAVVEFVMRRGQDGSGAIRDKEVGLPTEAAVIRAAMRHGVPVPQIVHELDEDDGLGTGFVMRRVHGETIARKILRDAAFDAVRPRLAQMAGAVLASIGQVPLDTLPSLPVWPARERLAALRETYERLGHKRPILEYGFRWLEERIPADPARLTLVHGDFRNGNLMIGPQVGIAAVLDWELVHIGDPMEDMGWLCTPSWRFGEIDKAAGGFGTADALIAGYEEAGGALVDRSLLQFWTVLGSLNWGLGCTLFAFNFRNGDRTVERGSIGRRISENELDIMMLTRAKDGVLL